MESTKKDGSVSLAVVGDSTIGARLRPYLQPLGPVLAIPLPGRARLLEESRLLQVISAEKDHGSAIISHGMRAVHSRSDLSYLLPEFAIPFPSLVVRSGQHNASPRWVIGMACLVRLPGPTAS